MKYTAKDIIDYLGLSQHPEGGYYKETYRSSQILKGSSMLSNLEGDRNCSTAIYYMLTSDSFSAFHRIKQDEIWHFYMGSPIEIHMIKSDGEYEKICLGLDLADGVFPQFTVEANTWFSANTKDSDGYSLVGCTVSPGFDFRDFEMGLREELLREFPQHRELIEQFTRLPKH